MYERVIREATRPGDLREERFPDLSLAA